MPTVFVIGEDWQLRAHVRAELREAGIEALGMESLDEAGRAIAGGTHPAAMVVDSSAADTSNPVLAQAARQVPVILVASRTGAATPPEGAVVMWRPVRVAEIVEKVKELLRGQAA
jgi:DNA-binding response OmpR family regulator